MKPRLLSTARLSFPLAAALAALLAVQSANATPYNWTGATAGTWNTTTNWSGSVVPLLADDLTILGPLNVAGALTIDFDADNSANSLNFTNTAATSVTNTTSGADKTLTLGGGGITTGAGAVQLGGNVANQAVNLTLGAAQSWNVGAGGMTVTNFIGGAGTGVTKTGAGNLTINTGTANGFTGGLNANGGTVTLDYGNLATPTNLVAATNALQIGNGTLTITGRNVAAATTAQTFAGTTLGAGANTINIAKGGLATSATLNLGALTVNTGSSTIISPTTAWTTTASTTERVFITAGGSVPALPAGANTAFVNAGVFHRVAGGLVGSLRLAAVNSSGQLQLRANAGNLAVGTVGDGTGSYQLHAGSVALTSTANIYGLLLNATSGGVNITIANSGTLTLSSVIQIKATESVNIVAGTGVSNLVIGSEKNLVLAMDNAAGLAINAPIVNNGGGASAVTILGSAPTGTPGAVTLGGANTYTGATTITRGTLNLANVNALQNTSGVTIGGAATATLASSTTGITITAPITTASTGITSTIAFGRGTAATGSLTLNGAIGGNGNVTFTTPNASSGGQVQTINLGAAATYAGNTTINTGNLNNSLTLSNSSGAANALPTTTVLTFGTGVGTGSGRTTTVDLNGQNQTLAGLSNAGAVPDDRIQRVSSTAAATLTINNTTDFTFGGATLEVGGTTTNAQITGAIALTKSGTGTFTLGGILTGGATAPGNTFTGTTKILGGILTLGETTSLQNSAFDTTNSILGAATNGLRTTVTTLTLGGLTGGNDFSTRFTTTTGGYSGLTGLTLNPGTGVTHNYSADIGDGAGGMALTKTGAGTQCLSGTNTYTGPTTASAGTLKLDFSAAGAGASNIISSSSALSLAGGTLAVQGKAATTNSQQFNGLSVTSGVASSIQLTADPSANPLLLTLGAITRSAGSALDFTLPAGTQSASNGITTTTPNASGNILGGWATIGGTVWASNNGTNIVPLSIFTLTSTAGTTAANYLDKDIDVNNSAGLLDGVISASSLIFNNPTPTTVTLAAGSNVISSGGILVNSSVGNNLSTITGGTLLGSASGELTIIQNNTSNSLLIASDIADNGGATGLSKTGAGTLVLSGTNSYTGGTTLTAGTLHFAKILAMPATGAVAVKTGTTLTVNAGGVGEFTNAISGNGSIGGLLAGLGGQVGSTVSYSGAVKLGIDTTNAGGSLAYSGVIANIGSSLGISKLGTGTLALDQINTYSGGTIISGGTLQVAAAGTLAAAGTISIASGATLQYSSTADQTLSGVISGAGSISKDTGSASTLTLSNAGNTLAGGITISAGRVAVASAPPLSSGTITCVGDSTVGGQLFVTGTPTITNNFVISGVGFPDNLTTPNTGRAGAIRPSNGQTYTGTVTLAGDSRIGVIGGTVTNTFTGRITGSFAMDFYGGLSANSLTQTFTLANTGTANDHTGNTSITSIDFGAARTGGKAILQLGASDQIPNGTGKGNLVFNGADADHIAILELNGFNETLNGVSNSAPAGAIIRNTTIGASTLTIGDAATTSSFSGVITDGGVGSTLALTKTGSGTLTLSGANSYLGATAVNAGTLALGASHVLPDASPFALGAATLDAAAVNDTVGILDVTGAGTINLGSGGTLAFAGGTATWTGGTLNITGTFISGSSLRFGTSSSGLTPAQLAVISVNGAGAGTYTLNGGGFLISPPAGGYSAWAATNASSTTPAQDQDGDGVNNAAEYVLGGTVTTNDLSKLPAVSTSGGNLIFTFQRDQDSIDGTTVVTIQVGTTLLTWPTSYNVPGPAQAVVPGVTIVKDTSVGFDTVTLSIPQAPDAAKFARLNVVVTP